MDAYHQFGHNFVWNIDSMLEDGSGQGAIISPVNVEADRLETRIPVDVRRRGFLDVQFYLPNDPKGKLASYPFFPANLDEGYSTSDFALHAQSIADECVGFQVEHDFRSIVIPTRYFDGLPSDHQSILATQFVEPFIQAAERHGAVRPILLTALVKSVQLLDEVQREDFLNWITSFPEVAGCYLIFESPETSKQVKDPEFLFNAMRVIRALKTSGLEVYVGYTGLEGLLYGVADPNAVTMGVYENLRRFGIDRLRSDDGSQRRAPTPRILAGPLLQSIPVFSIPPLRRLVPEWDQCFGVSPYLERLMQDETALSFQTPILYKHYFYQFSRMVEEISASTDRATLLREWIESARGAFTNIRSAGVLLDEDSDGSHLVAWWNALAMYDAEPGL